MMTRKTMIISLIGILVLLSISGCSGRSNKTPTQDNNAIILTAVANVTQDFFQTIIAFQNATPTPQPSQTLTATPTTIPTIARSPLPGETPTPSTGCNRIVAGVPFDITIPDDTSMQPGQSFTKTWRLVNNGTCKWTRLYAVVFFSGNSMSAHQSNYLNAEVLPGQSIDVSVEFIAPSEPGTYQSNWMLQSQNGDLFGLGPNGDAPFWVRIQVVEVASPTFTQTPTPTSTPTTTGTISPSPTETETATPTLTPSSSTTP